MSRLCDVFACLFQLAVLVLTVTSVALSALITQKGIVQEPKPYSLVNLVLSDTVFFSVDSGSLGHV